MASGLQSAVSQTQAGAPAPKVEDPQAAKARAAFLAQLNLQGVASHAAELRENLDIILNALLYQPDKVLWADVVSKFSVVSLQYHQLLDQLRPVLKHNVVFPKAVNEQNAARLPLMLATKLLPAMETDEAGMLQAHRLAAGSADLGAQIADLTAQTEHLNEVVRSLTEADATDAASGLLDPNGKRYKRLVADIKAGFAPAPTRQLPTQMATGQKRGNGRALVAAVARGEGLVPPATSLAGR